MEYLKPDVMFEGRYRQDDEEDVTVLNKDSAEDALDRQHFSPFATPAVGRVFCDSTGNIDARSVNKVEDDCDKDHYKFLVREVYYVDVRA